MVRDPEVTMLAIACGPDLFGSTRMDAVVVVDLAGGLSLDVVAGRRGTGVDRGVS